MIPKYELYRWDRAVLVEYYEGRWPKLYQSHPELFVVGGRFMRDIESIDAQKLFAALPKDGLTEDDFGSTLEFMIASTTDYPRPIREGDYILKKYAEIDGVTPMLDVWTCGPTNHDYSDKGYYVALGITVYRKGQTAQKLRIKGLRKV